MDSICGVLGATTATIKLVGLLIGNLSIIWSHGCAIGNVCIQSITTNIGGIPPSQILGSVVDCISALIPK